MRRSPDSSSSAPSCKPTSRRSSSSSHRLRPRVSFFSHKADVYVKVSLWRWMMLHELSDARHQEPAEPAPATGTSLRVVLWTLWVLAVAGAAFLQWRADIVAGHSVDLLGLVI